MKSILLKTVALTALVASASSAFATTVAKIGDAEYDNLADALNAVAADPEHKTLDWVDESVWAATDEVYYNGSFYTLEGAIVAACEVDSSDPAKLFVRPNYQGLTKNAHDRLMTSITIYGNNASLGGSWEPTFEKPGTDYTAADGCHKLTKNTHQRIYSLHDGAGLWGSRCSTYEVSLEMVNCSNAHEIMNYPSADKGITNVRLVNCDFEYSSGKWGNAAPFTNKNPGTTVIQGCSFANSLIAINACMDFGDDNSTLSLTVKDCKFDNCAGEGAAKGVIRTFGENGSAVNVTIDGCTFTGCSTTNPNVSFGKNNATENKAVINYTITKTAATVNKYTQATADLTSFTLQSTESVTGSTSATPPPNFYQDATDANLWHIRNLEGLKEFRDSVDNGTLYAGKTVVLDADVDLGNEDWNPIGDGGSNQFQGTFDGQKHTIANLYIDGKCDMLHGVKVATGKFVGLFAATAYGSVIRNLTLNNVELKNLWTCAGAVVGGDGSSEATISYVNVTGLIKIGDAVNSYSDDSAANYVGGIIGKGYGKIDHCTVSGTDGSFIKSSNYYIGGIAGFIGEGSGKIVSNCTVENVYIAGWAPVGGICGIAHYGNTIENCTVTSSVTIENYANIEAENRYFEINGMGGIAGITTSGADVTISGNTFAGTLVRAGTVLAPRDACLHNDGLVGVDRNATSSTTISQSNLKMSDNTSVYTPPVAQIGTTPYLTLAAAVAAVQDGQTIEMLADVTLTDKLVVSNGRTFTFDLGGKTLTGRVNVSGAKLTVKHGTIDPAGFKQALNVYGTMDKSYAEPVESATGSFTYVKVESDVTLKGSTGGLCVLSNIGDIYKPLAYGVKVDFYGVADGNAAASINGNIGYDNYVANLGGGFDTATYLPEGVYSVSRAMRLYGPVVNVYGRLASSNAAEPAVYLAGMVTFNVFEGAQITGAEAFSMKSGVVNVFGGSLTSTGPKQNPIQAVSSGAEKSGAAISASSYYTCDIFDDRASMAINVFGGVITGGHNAALLVGHSYSGGQPCVLKQGIEVCVAGGTFSAGDGQDVIYIEAAADGDQFPMPAKFISGGVFASKPGDAYVADGFIAKPDMPSAGLWTVGKEEIAVIVPTAQEVTNATEVVDEAGEPIQELPPQVVEQVAGEVQKAVDTLSNTALVGVEETGIGQTVTVTTGDTTTNKASIVELLKAEAKKAGVGADEQEKINSTNSVNTYVTYQLDKATVVVEDDAAALASVAYDVVPVASVTVTNTVGGVSTETNIVAVIPNNEIDAPITFRLPVADTNAPSAEIKHVGDDEHEDETYTVAVQGTAPNRYVELSATHFSVFVVTPSGTVITDSDETLGLRRVSKDSPPNDGEISFGVPYAGTTDGAAPTVARLLVAGYGANDKIRVWNTSNNQTNEYDTWYWNGTGWTAVLKTVGPNPAAADVAAVTRGYGVWFADVCSNGVDLVLSGYETAGVPVQAAAGTASAPKNTFLLNPSGAAFDAVEKFASGAAAGDQLMIVNDVSHRYEYDGTAWGEYKNVRTEKTVILGGQSRKITVTQRQFVPSATIPVPANTGVWYLSKGGNPTVNW